MTSVAQDDSLRLSSDEVCLAIRFYLNGFGSLGDPMGRRPSHIFCWELGTDVLHHEMRHESHTGPGIGVSCSRALSSLKYLGRPAAVLLAAAPHQGAKS